MEVKNLKVFLTDKEKSIQVLNKEKLDLSTKLDESLAQFTQLNESMKNFLQKSGTTTNRDTTTIEDDDREPDIVIFHDSLFKLVKEEGLMRKEKLKVKKVWAPRLKDALDAVMAMQEKPKVVLVHVGTNDMQALSEDDMIGFIKRIHEILSTRCIKFVYDFITPTGDRGRTAKAEVVNSRVVQLFATEEEVSIARNDKFYRNGVQNTRLFDEDGIHVNVDGTKALVLQTKEVLCRSLGIEYREFRPPFFNRKYGHNRNNR